MNVWQFAHPNKYCLPNVFIPQNDNEDFFSGTNFKIIGRGW